MSHAVKGVEPAVGVGIALEQHPAWFTWCPRCALSWWRVGRPDLLAGTFLSGSVTGAPESSALHTIQALESLPRAQVDP